MGLFDKAVLHSLGAIKVFKDDFSLQPYELKSKWISVKQMKKICNGNYNIAIPSFESSFFS